MPVLRTARRLTRAACTVTGAVTLSLLAFEAWLHVRDSREARKSAEEGVARIEAMLRDAGDQR